MGDADVVLAVCAATAEGDDVIKVALAPLHLSAAKIANVAVSLVDELIVNLFHGRTCFTGAPRFILAGYYVRVFLRPSPTILPTCLTVTIIVFALGLTHLVRVRFMPATALL